MRPHHVVIIGGGFGGLHAAKSLKRSPVKITLIDRNNYHLFQPLLYQVATGALSPANIAAPLRSILKRQRNADVLLAEVTGFDPANRRVIMADGEMSYDSLIVAAGTRTNYFGNPNWERLAPSLKTIEDATKIRRRILLAFERAERSRDRKEVISWLTFVVIGAGPTGVELAGAIAEIARYTLRHDFRRINPADARIILLDGVETVLPTFPSTLQEKARTSLERLGVVVRTGFRVTDVRDDSVVISKDSDSEQIPARTVLWAAGIQASPLGHALAKATGVAPDPAGRIVVDEDLTVPGHPEIFVIGDLAHFHHQTGKPLPGVAPVAIQQGRYAANLIKDRLRGEFRPPFIYKDYGRLATIGRSAAVADFGKLRVSGYLAWLAWLFIHLMYIVEFENRILILLQWAWNYFTRNRSARLIVGQGGSPGEKVRS